MITRETIGDSKVPNDPVPISPESKAFVDATAPLPGERFPYNKYTVLDWGWLKIEKNWHWRYSSEETHVTAKLPLRRKRFFDPLNDVFETGKRALFVAFGGVGCSRHGFHLRGDVIYVDQTRTPYTDLPELGHKNPINLANYK